MMNEKEFEEALIRDPTETARELYRDLKMAKLDVNVLRARIDPTLREDMLIGNLSLTCSAANYDLLQVGAMLALVGAFDRKVPRDAFVPMAEHASAMFGLLGRLCISESILHMMEREAFTKDKIEQAVKELISYAEVERKKLLETMKLIAQLPKSYDTIN